MKMVSWFSFEPVCCHLVTLNRVSILSHVAISPNKNKREETVSKHHIQPSTMRGKLGCKDITEISLFLCSVLLEHTDKLDKLVAHMHCQHLQIEGAMMCTAYT